MRLGGPNDSQQKYKRIAVFWALAAVSNLAGAVIVGWLVSRVQIYQPEQNEVVRHVVEKKMRY